MLRVINLRMYYWRNVSIYYIIHGIERVMVSHSGNNRHCASSAFRPAMVGIQTRTRDTLGVGIVPRVGRERLNMADETSSAAGYSVQ